MKELAIHDWLGPDNTLGYDIWENKYRQNGESFDGWLDRVSNGNVELRKVIVEKKFLFAGRILSNRGDDTRGITYSNCYVMTPPEDNIESIFHTAGKLARTFSYGGGCGIDISRLAPKGARVNNSAKETSGAVSFMELYSMVTGLIGQNGRRGALMLSMDINHPDIEEFITIKNDLDKVTKANISIKITDKFMTAVDKNDTYDLEFTRSDTGEVISKTVDAKALFRTICESNWDYAEPGMLFWDRIKDWNMLSNNDEFEFAGVNPCAEEPLPAGGSCLLGSINLAEFVTKDKNIDENELRRVVRIATIALNGVLDEGLQKHPLIEQRESVAKWRQMGLGIFGLADMFIKMGVTYGGENSLNISRRLAHVICDEAVLTSAQLASIEGPYPGYNGDVANTPFIIHNVSPETRAYVAKHGLRNSQILSIAPTGSISTMLGVSGGIEPIFATHYNRKTESLHGEDRTYTVYTPIVKEYMDSVNMTDVKNLPYYFITSPEIDHNKRVRMQAAWQDKIDASISSTINLPYEATVEDVMNIYMAAWEAGLKGITVYRDRCKRSGILTNVEEPKEEKPKVTIDSEGIKIDGVNMITDLHSKNGFGHISSKMINGDIQKIELDSITPLTRTDLGDVLQGSTYVKHTACGKMYITINRNEDNQLVEVFIDPGKSGGCTANAEALGRYASACMRSGMTIKSIIDTTRNVKCSACTKIKGSKAKDIDGHSCGDILSRAIEEEYKRYKYSDSDNRTVILTMPTYNKKTIVNTSPIDLVSAKIEYLYVCPECGKEITNQGGCTICLNCGHSKCD